MFRNEEPLKLGMQFFAEETPPANDPPATTFTQEQVNAIASKEKDEGRASGRTALLEELGISDVETLKGLVKNHTDSLSQEAKDLETANKNNQTLQGELEIERQKNQRLVEASLVQAHQVPEGNREAVLTLARAGVSDTVDFETSLKATLEKFPHFLETEEERGTGGNLNFKKPQSSGLNIGDLAAKLGEQRAEKKQVENPYFK